ncbi:peptide ABC transporter permease [Pantoea rodasii]|uniref:Peptide ABC transporter permease n=1 Tax=Pantoea rodasii TaxID=1076549 RepID=A0A2M9W8Y7_9GAMM|nr:ABC transporter permease [Pantoea rodasii]ORM63596.1 peptide ABC transporter permease [Pantoea rodasii]PJZ03997.1 peptide ABC transporter permease [Pantoea rodasii]
MSNPPLLLSRRQFRWRFTHPLLSLKTLFPAAVIVLLLLIVIAPQWFALQGPEEMDMEAVLQPPSWQHFFGTDALGRDVYSRVIYGSALSLSIGVGATLLGCAGGIVLGVLASLGPRSVQKVVVRVLDILLAFPELLLALLVIAVLGRGPVNTLLAVGLSSIAGYARLLRSQILQVKLSGYVQQAVIVGERPLTIVIRHIIPNTLRPLLILVTLGIGQSVLHASSLSFLGMGVIPPMAEWGAMLAEGRDYFDIAPWMSLLPATVVALSVIALTLFGRRLQVLLLQGKSSR